MNIQDNSTIQSHPEVRTSEGDKNSGVNLQTEASATPSQNRKRCAWSVKENYKQLKIMRNPKVNTQLLNK
jgi:hypothetical protein